MQLMTDLVGRTLSERYRLGPRLSGSHLGDLYEGRDQLLGRPVAVKVLPHSLSVDESVVERFREEARAVARLTHPNTVAVYDWGADAGTFYMVMEPVPATDLRDLLVAKGSLAAAQAADLMAQVCDVLSAAHRCGLVHRALKPESILITDDGIVKVADFGLSAVLPREHASSSSGMTTAVRYMSPEQALGFEASATSDVWAAGAILAEMLTGRPPLQGAGTELLEKRAHEEPVAPSRFDSSIPRELDEIVLKACALDPAQRFYDPSDMAHALRRAGARSLPAAPPVEELVDDISTELETVPADPNPFVMETARGRHGKPKLKLRVGRIVMSLVLVILLVGTASAAAYLWIVPQSVDVPDMVGLTPVQARDRAEERGLEVVVEGRARDIETPEGKIVRQTPGDGELREGEAIEVIVSAGPPLVRIPAVEGLPASRARDRLKGNNFEIGRVLERHSMKEDRGIVLRQLPKKGRHEWGSKVHLVVSKGPPPVRVPRVERTLAVVAMKKLERAGLRPQQVEVYSEGVDAGLVISTSPRAGKTLHKGDKIEVVVSLGPEFEEVTVPDLRNKRTDRAVAELGDTGLQAEVVESCKKAKRVVDTDPVAGTVVRENDVITLFVC